MKLVKIVFKNTLRHKLRTGLTVIGIAVAVLAFCLLRTVIHAWYAGVEASAANRLITRNAISLIFPLPLSYMTKIKQIPGVTGVTYANWFGGIYIDEKHFFPQIAIDAKTFFNLYPEIAVPEDQKIGLPARAKGLYRRTETGQPIPLEDRERSFPCGGLSSRETGNLF